MLQKTFYKTLMEFSLNPAKAKQCLTDKRLTLIEKKILEGHLLIRNNQNRQALDLMNSLSSSEYAFVEGQRKLLIGLALHNLSYYAEAELKIKESLVLFSHQNVPYFDFIANSYLFFIYANQNQIKLMKEILAELESIPITTEVQKVKLLRCRFDYLAKVDIDAARKVLFQIDAIKDTMSESDIISHLVCEFKFFVKCEDFIKCESLLKEMKKYRKFNLKENFNFMKLLLNHLNKNAPIYFYGDDFKAVPLLYFQLKVIHAMEEKNFPEAQKSWDELNALYPDIYLPGFNYTGSKCLFSLCLKKHCTSRDIVVNVAISENTTKLNQLVQIILSAQAPIHKGYLYELLWGDLPENKGDLAKLTKLISRARIEIGIEIKTRKGTYYIDKIPQKSKVS